MEAPSGEDCRVSRERERERERDSAACCSGQLIYKQHAPLKNAEGGAEEPRRHNARRGGAEEPLPPSHSLCCPQFIRQPATSFGQIVLCEKERERERGEGDFFKTTAARPSFRHQCGCSNTQALSVKVTLVRVTIRLQ